MQPMPSSGSETVVNQNIDRRTLLAAASSGVVIVSLGGCFPAKPSNDGKPRPHYVMVFDQRKCVGCGECKIACNQVNHLPKGRSRCLIEQVSFRPQDNSCKPCGPEGPCFCDRKFVRVSCQQCENSPCVTVCPTGACHHDPATGIVTMDADKCVGCKYCIAACPYNARYINEETKVADNCDFCLHSRLQKGQTTPGCVEKCRYGALIFGDVNDPDSYVNKVLAAFRTVRVRPQLGTKPGLRYIPIIERS